MKLVLQNTRMPAKAISVSQTSHVTAPYPTTAHLPVVPVINQSTLPHFQSSTSLHSAPHNLITSGWLCLSDADVTHRRLQPCRPPVGRCRSASVSGMERSAGLRRSRHALLQSNMPWTHKSYADLEKPSLITHKSTRSA